MNKFVIDDIVKLISLSSEYEGVKWAVAENLQLYNTYQVLEKSSGGWIRVKPGGYFHHPEKFELCHSVTSNKDCVIFN